MKRSEVVEILSKDISALYGTQENPIAADWILKRLESLNALPASDLKHNSFTISSVDKIKLVLARVEILKIKADDYTWSCYVPDNVKKQLEESLKEIDGLLEKADKLERTLQQPGHYVVGDKDFDRITKELEEDYEKK